jgi:cyclopropane fatty-acyl-phospholipid synthase-like methyltransferase
MKKVFFNLWYLLQKPPWDTGISPPELMAYIQTHPPGRALDLGCGTGTNVITLAEHGWQATGVDFALPAIRKARRKARQARMEAQFLAESVTRLVQVNGPFELILDMGCFHNLAAAEKAVYIRNLERLLAPGGSYLLYGFFKADGTTGIGLEEADVASLADRFQLLDRTDGFNPGGQPSAWFTFTRGQIL